MSQKNKNEEILKTYTPVTIFIIATFILRLYEVSEGTNLIISVFLSMISFMVKSAMLKEKFGKYEGRKKIAFQSGLLTIIFIVIFLNGFLHWYKIWHIDVRITIYFILMLIYLVLLFRAVHILKATRVELENKNIKKKK